MTSGKAPRPKTDAQMAFDLLMELYDRGQTLDTKSQVELVNKFLAVREPGRQVPRWGFFLKANRAERIVNALREGLDDLRDRKPFIRPALAIDITNVETFQDGIVWDQLHGRVARTGSRDPRHLFFTRVFELLTEVAPWLRVCSARVAGDSSCFSVRSKFIVVTRARSGFGWRDFSSSGSLLLPPIDNLDETTRSAERARSDPQSYSGLQRAKPNLWILTVCLTPV